MTAFSFDDSAYQRYLFEYRFDGSEWRMEIMAKSPEEAHERIKALAWAHYKGRIIATLPAALGPFGMIAAWIRNVLFSR